MINEQALESAREKLKFAEIIDKEVTDGIVEVQSRFFILFQEVFDTVLPQELTYDEILAFAQHELDNVYAAFGPDADSSFHGENIEDDPFGRSVEDPD